MCSLLQVNLMIQCHAFSIVIDVFSTFTRKSWQGKERHKNHEPTGCSQARSQARRQKGTKVIPLRKGNQNSDKRIQVCNHGDCVAHFQHGWEQVCCAIHGVMREGGKLSATECSSRGVPSSRNSMLWTRTENQAAASCGPKCKRKRPTWRASEGKWWSR